MPLHSCLGIFTSVSISYSGRTFLLFLTQAYIFWRPPLIAPSSSFALARCCMLPCDQRNPRSLFCGSMRKKGTQARTRLSLCSQSLQFFSQDVSLSTYPTPTQGALCTNTHLVNEISVAVWSHQPSDSYLYLASAPLSPNQLLFIRVCLCFLLFPLFLGGKLHDKPLLCA